MAEEKSLKDWVLLSFLTEVNALKPGNVSQYASGHDMELQDFITSAELVSPILCNPALGVGERVYQSVKATQEGVGCNTNLGMLLLFAPLVKAVEEKQSGTGLRQNLERVLSTLDNHDAEYIFRAISLAKPGGLGESERYDVNSVPEVSVQEAMEEAKRRDRIALQYVTAFDDIFNYGFNAIKDYILRWNSVEWSAVMCYLVFLSRYPDSHIARKYGEARAEEIRNNSKGMAALLKEQVKPESIMPELLEYDKTLKTANINPGTTADLTAASILVYFLDTNYFKQ